MNSIQARLMTTIAAGILILLAVSSIAVTSLTGKVQEYRALIEGVVDHERRIHGLNLDLKTQVQEWKNVLLRGADDTSRDRYWRQFNTLHNSIQTESRALIDSMSPGPARDAVSTFQRNHTELLLQYSTGLDIFISSGFDPVAGDVAVTGIDREPTELLQAAADIISKENGVHASALSASSDRVALLSRLMVAGIAILVLITVWLMVKRGFIAPLHQIMQKIQGLSEGNFRQAFSSSRKDELGKLMMDLANMQSEIARIIGAVQETTVELSTASTAINKSASDITGHTSKTETWTDQVAVAVTEMNQTVQEVAGNAGNAASAAEQVDASSQTGLLIMNRTIESINALSTEVNNVAQVMSQLEQDTASVGAVLDVIKNIAEQTNLLALNAAIEAARAGEQGRGFAVVADEVRALARRTQESTAEIQQIIETVQNGAANAVLAMEAGQAKTRNTVELARESGHALGEITQAVTQIKDMITQIATAAEEQSYATEEINKNIEHVVELVQLSGKSAQQSAAIAGTLELTSGRMTELVRAFRV